MVSLVVVSHHWWRWCWCVLSSLFAVWCCWSLGVDIHGDGGGGDANDGGVDGGGDDVGVDHLVVRRSADWRRRPSIPTYF